MDSSDSQSFDPRTWANAGPNQVPTAPPAAAPVPSAPAIDRQWGRRLSAAAPVAILLTGAAAALLMRADPPATADASFSQEAPPSADAPVAAKSDHATMTQVLPDTGGLRDALVGAGVDPAEASAATAAALQLLGGRPGEIRSVLTLDMAQSPPRIVKLAVSFEDSSGAVITPTGANGFQVAPVTASLNTELTAIRGEMDAESFYSSAVAAGVPDTLIADFAKALAFDFDFQREIRPGDVFEAGFEQQVNASGQVVGQPKLLYVSMITDEKSRSFYWFQAPGGEGGWFDGNGASIVRSLMRTPVDGARVSSQFGYRKHPVLGYQKLHEGTDFAAPTGTPIFAAGSGVVEFAAMKGANGNLTILRHENGWQTYYLHQSRFSPGIAPGTRVSQGQQIGEVGTTGRSTGPHLHYGLKIDGKFVDAMSIQTESSRALTGAERAAFIRERDRIDVARAAQAG